MTAACCRLLLSVWIDWIQLWCYGLDRLATYTLILCIRYCFAAEDTTNQISSFDARPPQSAWRPTSPGWRRARVYLARN